MICSSITPAVPEHSRVDAADREYQLWERNPLSIELRTDKVYRQKLDYIDWNPVRAGICKLPEEYIYSSALFYETGVDNWGFFLITVTDRSSVLVRNTGSVIKDPGGKKLLNCLKDISLAETVVVNLNFRSCLCFSKSPIAMVGEKHQPRRSAYHFSEDQQRRKEVQNDKSPGRSRDNTSNKNHPSGNTF